MPGMTWYSDIGGLAWHSNNLTTLFDIRAAARLIDRPIEDDTGVLIRDGIKKDRWSNICLYYIQLYSKRSISEVLFSYYELLYS
jgi:hypothetical protein